MGADGDRGGESQSGQESQQKGQNQGLTLHDPSLFNVLLSSSDPAVRYGNSTL
jgi:phosphoenolpyruvate carboxylase